MPISAGSSSTKVVKCSSNRKATSKTHLQTGNHDKPVDMLISDKSMEVSTNRQNCDTLAKLQSTHNFARISSVCGPIDSNKCINTHSSNANNDPDNLGLEESSSKRVSLINCSDDMFESYEAEHFKLPEETHKENLHSEDLPIYVTRRKATCTMGLDDSMVCLVSPEAEVLHLRTRDVTRTKHNNLKNSAKGTKTSGFKKKSFTTRYSKECHLDNFIKDALEESVARSSAHITDVQDVLEESVARSSVPITDVQDALEESVARSSAHITDVQDVLEESVARSSVHITDVQDVLEESVARSSVHITDVQDVLEESLARSSVHITDVQDVLEESLARSSVHITDVQDVLEESLARSSVHITDVQDVLEVSLARSSVHITDVQDVLEESVARSSVHITDVQDVLEESVARSSVHITHLQDVLEESLARSSLHITDVQDVLEESVARSSVHITDLQDVLEESLARSSLHITDVQDVLEESVARSSVHITDLQDVLEESLARSSVHGTGVQDVLEESLARSISHVQDVLEESLARSSVPITGVQDVLEESLAKSISHVQDVLEESLARSSVHGPDNCHIHTKKLQSTEERKINLEYTPKKTYQTQTPKSMKRKRCTRLVIAGRDSSQNLSRQSIFKDVCCSFNGTFARSSINEEGTNSPTQREEVLHSACDVVLSKCHLKRILLFSDVFSFSFLDKCSKIGEGVYGEVFSCEESCSVIKIIPIEGNQLVNGEPQKTFKEILSEIVITIELSNLRCSQYNTTSAFTEVLRCLCVQGRYPHRLIELWNIYAENKGTENDSPEMFAEDQLFIILELTHGGTDLEAYHFQSAEQAFSVYQQRSFTWRRGGDYHAQYCIATSPFVKRDFPRRRCSEYHAQYCPATSSFVKRDFPRRCSGEYHIQYCVATGLLVKRGFPQWRGGENHALYSMATGPFVERSSFFSVAHALAVAECSLEFEHRDLHWGNILISPTRDTISRFCIRGKQIDVATKGVKASFASLIQKEDGVLLIIILIKCFKPVTLHYG
uniref:Protein kinase domain-containing protein n=1 Tax=Timema poppense TaxID=170557 RepID=A0A7R9D0E6_TIMPO|nr:unnamed protein product [Timema poppensis]